MAASPADPPSFLKALGTCPHPTLVQSAHLALTRLDNDLAAQLVSLRQDPHDEKAEEEAKLREEVEKAKLPYKSIVSLYELHRIYEGLVSTCSQDARMKKTLEVLNSFSKKGHVNTTDISTDVAKTVLELSLSQKNTIEMDLSRRCISDLPASLCRNFSHLVSLDLSNNQLKDLPNSIADLDSLEVLDLQSNQLLSLPDAIGFLEKLTVLNVSGNMLVALPDSLGGCRKLRDINASFNQLKRLPTRIGFDLPALQNLCVDSNKLTVLPASICELRQLKFLDLHFNNLTSLPELLGSLSALEKLNISNNFSDFGDGLPDSLGDLVFLVELDVSFNQLRVLPDWVGGLENLKVLKYDNNPLVMPPPEIASQGAAYVLAYLSMRWRTTQTSDQEGCSSPSKLNGFKVGFRGAACGGSSLVSWLSGRRSTSNRNALPSMPLHGKQ